MAKKELEQTRPAGAPARSVGEVRPAVDVYEDKGGITLTADLPGVSRERLHIEVDQDVLTLSGDAELDQPEGVEPLYADVRATHYRRSFRLTSELDPERIDARLQDGLLTLRIPKREAALPQRIEVKAA